MKFRFSNISIALFLIALLTISCYAQSADLIITKPAQDDGVGLKVLVRGKTINTLNTVNVLVHPMSTSLWWVQKSPTSINSDSSWQTICYCGTEKDGKDDFYEIIAIITQKVLKAGETLEVLPKCIAKSDLVTVQRIK